MEIFYPGQMIKGAFVTCAFQVFLPQLRPDYPLGVYYFVFFLKKKDYYYYNQIVCISYICAFAAYL